MPPQEPSQELPLFQKPSLVDLLGTKIPQLKDEQTTRHVVAPSFAHPHIIKTFDLSLPDDKENLQIMVNWVNWNDIYHMQFSADLSKVIVIYTEQDFEIPYTNPLPFPTPLH